MEYFIGLVPPSGYLQKVSDFQRQWSASRLPDFVEPHVTLKAQNGLTADLAWLERVRAVCASVKPFAVTLGEPGGFADRVLFLTVAAPDLYELHQRLLDAINPPLDQRERYFEGKLYHPHLTLGIAGNGITERDLVQMRQRAVEELQPYPRFEVDFLRVYQYDGQPGGGYRPLVDLAFGGT